MCTCAFMHPFVHTCVMCQLIQCVTIAGTQQTVVAVLKCRSCGHSHLACYQALNSYSGIFVPGQCVIIIFSQNFVPFYCRRKDNIAVKSSKRIHENQDDAWFRSFIRMTRGNTRDVSESLSWGQSGDVSSARVENLKRPGSL